MLGVGALGLVATYLLITAPRDQGPRQDRDGPPPQPIPPTSPLVPLPTLPTAGTIDAPPPDFPIVATAASPTVHLTNSRAYRGRLELQADAPPELTRRIVFSMGFDPDTIQVFSTPTEAASHVPTFALANAGLGTRWFHARFLEATRDIPRPRELVALWLVAGPPIRAIIAGYEAPAAIATFGWDPRRLRPTRRLWDTSRGRWVYSSVRPWPR